MVSAAPPPFAPPPEDHALSTRISKLAEYYTRNGPAFEELLKAKQKDNPEYAFLFGGPGCEFYAWCLFCMPRGLPLDKALPDDFVDGRSAPVSTAPAEMPEEVASGFRQVLEMLNGTQESIKASSAWFMACSMHAAGMADMMVRRLQSLPDFASQLNIIYLMNDILFVGPRLGPMADQRMTVVFVPRLGTAMATAYKTSGRSPDALTQLQQLLQLWRGHGLLDAAALDQINAALTEGPAVAANAPGPMPVHPGGGMMPGPLAGAAHPAPAAFSGDPHGGAPHAWPHQHPHHANAPPPWSGAPPPGYVAPGQPPLAWGGPPAAQFPPPHVPHAHAMHVGSFPGAAPGPGPAGPSTWAAPPPEALTYPLPHAHHPAPEPYDILSFPAGIIPKLLRRHLRYEAPYTPLTPDDIDREPPPPLPNKDSYMKSRLDKYYAEIAEYRPGMVRAKYEETRKPGVDTKDQREAMNERQAAHDDGSYTGGPELERGGLGSHTSSHSNADDPYALYRRSRSGRYHEVMAQKSTNVHRPPRGY